MHDYLKLNKKARRHNQMCGSTYSAWNNQEQKNFHCLSLKYVQEVLELEPLLTQKKRVCLRCNIFVVFLDLGQTKKFPQSLKSLHVRFGLHC